MKPRQAIITAAGAGQEQLPLQTLIDRGGEPCSALSVQLAELAEAGVETVAVVIREETDAAVYRRAAGNPAVDLNFIVQPAANRGFGHAVLSAADFVGDEPFILMVGDHICVSDDPARGCTAQLIAVAQEERCLLSAVQPTHESQLAQFGVVGGRPIAGRPGRFEVTVVREKPTPTQAEQELTVAGQRVAHYLCFFGLHVLTAEVLELLRRGARDLEPGAALGLSPALDESVGRGRYAAVRLEGHRYELLAEIVELLAVVKP